MTDAATIPSQVTTTVKVTTEESISIKCGSEGTVYKPSSNCSEVATSSTASSTSSEAEEMIDSSESASSNHEDQLNIADQQAIVLGQLARQLEYYFSNHNLSTDTYLQTLRSLNDGCAPVAILATFAKVKVLVPGQNEETRVHALLQAAAEYSELLKVYSIDTATGKLATDDTPSSAKTILAIGTVSQEPLEMNLSPPNIQQHAVSVEEAFTNTIILRDVPPHVRTEQIRALFDEMEGCPAVTSIQQDVAHHWFVTLDTDSRQDMLRVVMQLRSSLLEGAYPVHARLKATSAPPVVDPAAVVWGQAAPLTKKKKKRGKKKRKNSGGKMVGSTTTEAKKPPSMDEDDFPTLQDKKVEFETPLEDIREDRAEEEGDEDDEEGPKSIKSTSDGASTATTTSTSSSSMSKKSLGGYAAALCRGTQMTVGKPNDIMSRSTSAPKLTAFLGTAEQESELAERSSGSAPSAANLRTSASWGGGMSSFANILRRPSSS